MKRHKTKPEGFRPLSALVHRYGNVFFGARANVGKRARGLQVFARGSMLRHPVSPLLISVPRKTSPHLWNGAFRRPGSNRILLVAGALVAAAAASGLLVYGSLPAVYLPGFAQVKAAHTLSEAVLFDRNGEIIHQLRIDNRGRRLDWVLLKDVSPALRSAILIAEDHRFYRHRGVDWASMIGALKGFFGAGSLRGASTITMQLAARLNEELQPQAARRSFGQKLRQIHAARALERRWSKEEILEAYLNLVTYRGELTGIGAASTGLYGKKPHGLGDSESLILAALVRSPNASVEQVGIRACALANAMGLRIGREEILHQTNGTLSRPYFVQPQAALAPHIARQLLRRDTPAVTCTLDGSLQRFAAETLRHHLESLRAQNVRDGAVLVVENRTGDVLAYVGNDGDRSSARYVDGIRAARQAGSILKPFIYGLAFESRLLTPASLIDDSPLDVPVGGGIYRPKNYDNHFHGLVTSRVALAASLNVPAVKTLNLLGVENVVGRLGDLGFSNLRAADYYGPSLALGAADITLWDLVNAYRTLANGGTHTPLRLTFSATDEPVRRVYSAEAAFLIADILSDRESRGVTFNLESPLSTRFWTAVKTGTSKDMRDNWCVGFSGRYTVGAWAGNFSGQPMWDISGVTGAAPVWVEIMNWLHNGDPGASPRPPSGVLAAKVQMPDFALTREEWFIRGTETHLVRQAASGISPRIVYPAAGTVVALDPDIPVDDQKLLFEAEPEGNSLHWVLDGHPLGAAGSVLVWTPEKGKHTLALVDAGGRLVDTVSFEVRGSLGFAGRSSISP